MDSQSQLVQYIPVLILFLVAAFTAAAMLIASVVAGKWANRAHLRNAKAKNIPYECGMLPTGEGHSRLSIKFYLVAMLFILFDIEVVFMYPWAIVYKDLVRQSAGLIFGGMISFLGILFIGYVYALKKKAFDWKS
jgi:NADH-quinone oxidoreductase subunit A